MYCQNHIGERECPYCGRLYDATDGAENCGCQWPFEGRKVQDQYLSALEEED